LSDKNPGKQWIVKDKSGLADISHVTKKGQGNRMTESTAYKPIILVVDDSRLMRVAARKILKNDFEILEAEDGEVAWNILQDNRQINLVMSDLSMPNLDGLGLLRKIRESSDAYGKELPVIIVTGAEDDDGSKNSALAAGASDFITKPFESVQLLARTQAQAKQQRIQQALHDSETRKQQLEKHSSVDALTGLANRRAFLNDIEENLSYTIRHGTELAILLVQVEKYKALFLRRGKQTAEQVLRQLAGLLDEDRRREDIVARFGMDTFGILLPSANLTGARRVAEQLHLAIKQQDFNVDDEPVPVNVTIAVTSPPVHAQINAAELLADAGEKLKIAQKSGGDRVQNTLAETKREQSTQKPVAEQPEPTRVATIADVQRALQSLASGDSIEISTVELARAVLPILEAWNRAHENKHSALLTRLESALQAGDSKEPLTASSICPTVESLY
jgi:diguanylate cyclase (GGDEF)-like protein